MIDTGAPTSFISEHYFKQRNFEKTQKENRKLWVTSNGTPIQVLGQVNLNAQIGETTFNAKFIIARDLAANVIMGTDISKSQINASKNALSITQQTP